MAGDMDWVPVQSRRLQGTHPLLLAIRALVLARLKPEELADIAIYAAKANDEVLTVAAAAAYYARMRCGEDARPSCMADHIADLLYAPRVNDISMLLRGLAARLVKQ